MSWAYSGDDETLQAITRVNLCMHCNAPGLWEFVDDGESDPCWLFVCAECEAQAIWHKDAGHIAVFHKEHRPRRALDNYGSLVPYW